MEFIILLVSSLISVIIGIRIGWQARENHAQKVVAQHLKKIEEEVDQESKELVPIKIEQHNGVIFVYNKNDNSFMAQGKSKKELEDALSLRFPGKRFSATQEELDKADLLL